MSWIEEKLGISASWFSKRTNSTRLPFRGPVNRRQQILPNRSGSPPGWSDSQGRPGRAGM